MPTTHVHSRPHAGADATHDSLIERRLRRYSPRAQELVRALAERHPRVADLAVSFPVLLFAFAVPRPGADPERAIASVIHGCALAQVADEVWWAAMRWLHQHDLSRVDTRQREWGKVPPDAAAWRKVWRPYWLAKRRIPPWLPLTPSRRALNAL